MSHRTHHGRQIDQHAERVFRDPAIMALLALGTLCIAIGLLGGCMTRVTATVPLADGRTASMTYFSTKAQKWVWGFDPSTHLPTGSVNADTPTGWSGQDAGAFAQGILTGAGSAIGAGISAAAGKPPTPPIIRVPPPVVVVPPPPEPPPAMLQAPNL